MMRPAAFLGLFADLGVDATDGALRVTVKLPVDALRHLASVIGLPRPAPPPDPDALSPGLLIAPCRRPIHPETEEQMLVEAALGILRQLAPGLGAVAPTTPPDPRDEGVKGCASVSASQDQP